MFMYILIISISLSVDALGIGMSYQLKNVRIPVLAKVVIGFVSAVIMLISLNVGNLMSRYFPNQVFKIIGIVILCLIGLAFIRNSLYGDSEKTCDFDKNTRIEFWEAIVLGGVLSADSVSAGIAAAAVGLSSILIPVTVGVMQVVFLYAGESLIKRCSFLAKKSNGKICGLFSGCLLILIALLRGFA